MGRLLWRPHVPRPCLETQPSLYIQMTQGGRNISVGQVYLVTVKSILRLSPLAQKPSHMPIRYSNMHGKFVLHPVDGRRFPIICDAELVDMSFGTGAVKVWNLGIWWMSVHFQKV